jgi:hypothetical protein
MVVLREICAPGGKNNEDACIYKNDSYVLVLDGSTGLGDNIIKPAEGDDWRTDAQWFVQTFCALVKRHMDNFMPIRELVRACIAELAELYWARVPEETGRLNQPSASMALVKRTGDDIEVLAIGDLTVLIENDKGEIDNLTDSTVSDMDDQVIEQMAAESRARKISVKEAGQLTPIRERLKQNRMRKNTEGGYWVLGLEPSAVEHCAHRSVPIDSLKRILICSDGFAAYTRYELPKGSEPEQLLDEMIKKSPEAMLRKIRAAERADPDLNRYPRFKMSDDATAVLIANEKPLERRKDSLFLKTNVVWHRFKGKWQSNLMTFGIKKAYKATVIAALSAAAKLIYDILQSDLAKLDGVAWALLLLLVFISLWTLLSTILAYREASFRYFIYSDPAKKTDVLHALKLRREQLEAGYQIDYFFNGREREYFVSSPRVDECLKTKQIILRDIKRRFTLADDVKKLVPAVMKLTFQNPRVTFNGRLLRQITDLVPNTSEARVQLARYFDGQCTQEIVFKQFKSVQEIAIAFDGKQLLMDNDGCLYPLDYSSCANFIGVSTMVFTRDQKIIVGRQDTLSKANPGRYAPSGSGSLEYSDIKETKARLGRNKDIPLQEVLITAMEREFFEECNLAFDRAAVRTKVIGFARLLERGGKPDYFGVSYIDEDSENVISKIKRTEYGLCKQFSILSFRTAADIPGVLRHFCETYRAKRLISIQVELITQLLERIGNSNGMDTLMRQLTAE